MPPRGPDARTNAEPACLNAISAAGGEELDLVRRGVRGFGVACAADLATALHRLAAREARHAGPPPVRALDLIGHAGGDDRLLELGGWRLGPDAGTAADFAALAPILRALGVGHVRLLGCATATTEAGLRTMARLHAALQAGPRAGPPIQVWGSRALLGPHCYGRLGLLPRHHALLRPYPAAPAPGRSLTAPAPPAPGSARPARTAGPRPGAGSRWP